MGVVVLKLVLFQLLERGECFTQQLEHAHLEDCSLFVVHGKVRMDGHLALEDLLVLQGLTAKGFKDVLLLLLFFGNLLFLPWVLAFWPPFAISALPRQELC